MKNTPCYLKHRQTGTLFKAGILKASKKDMPARWQFDWKLAYEKNQVYKIVLDKSPEHTEGLVKVTLKNNEQACMELLEVAPHNYGSKDCIYEWVAGCLIAYCCRLAFQKGKGYYKGFLSFESKSQLAEHYRKQYGATQIGGSRFMYFDPVAGIKNIESYLNLAEED